MAYFLRRVTEDHAHDLVAEVFLVAWRRRAIAPDEPDLRPWLFKVARNVLRNHHRGAARRMRLAERLRPCRGFTRRGRERHTSRHGRSSLPEAIMMHDADDATFMQALRDADPLRGSTPDGHARRRLEQSLVSTVLTQRDDGTGATVQGDVGGVAGSFRAVQQHEFSPTNTFLVAGGRALVRQSGGWNMPSYRPTNWAGFGDVTSMRYDPQVLFDGDLMYVRISTDEEPFRWYRYSGTDPTLPPGLAETAQPVFDEAPAASSGWTTWMRTPMG